MATPVPAGIEASATVETRLGTLSFCDGFPDDASVEKLFDNLDFQIEKGKPFAPDTRMKGILTEAATVGNATARALT
jgi:hypothetical protein